MEVKPRGYSKIFMAFREYNDGYGVDEGKPLFAMSGIA